MTMKHVNALHKALEADVRNIIIQLSQIWLSDLLIGSKYHYQWDICPGSL